MKLTLIILLLTGIASSGEWLSCHAFKLVFYSHPAHSNLDSLNYDASPKSQGRRKQDGELSTCVFIVQKLYSTKLPKMLHLYEFHPFIRCCSRTATGVTSRAGNWKHVETTTTAEAERSVLMANAREIPTLPNPTKVSVGQVVTCSTLLRLSAYSCNSNIILTTYACLHSLETSATTTSTTKAAKGKRRPSCYLLDIDEIVSPFLYILTSF